MFNVHIIKGICPRPTCQEGSPGKIAFYLRTKVIRKKWCKKIRAARVKLCGGREHALFED